MNPYLSDLSLIGKELMQIGQMVEENQTGIAQRAQVTDRNRVNSTFSPMLTDFPVQNQGTAQIESYRVNINRRWGHYTEPLYGPNSVAIDTPCALCTRKRTYPFENVNQTGSIETQPEPNGMRIHVPTHHEAHVNMGAIRNVFEEAPAPKMARVQTDNLPQGSMIYQEGATYSQEQRGPSVNNTDVDMRCNFEASSECQNNFGVKYCRPRSAATSYNGMAQGMPFWSGQNNNNFAVSAKSSRAHYVNSFESYQNAVWPQQTINTFATPGQINSQDGQVSSTSEAWLRADQLGHSQE